jgi:uncharacterized protein YyaL (SSP411 family)
VQGQIARYPAGHCALLAAQAELLAPPTTVVLRGPASECVAWALRYARIYRPHTVIVDANNLSDLPPGMTQPAGEHALAYVCRGSACLPPADPAQVEALLARTGTQ